MTIFDRVEAAVSDRTERHKSMQHPDGSWHYCFEGPVMDDAFTIILLRSLRVSGCEPLILKLANRLKSLQRENGAWNVYPDETDGNLSATVQAYTALLYSGHANYTTDFIKTAEAFILSKGGLNHTDFLTKVMLAMNGCFPWPK
ncbi:MAG TPA: squalene--hopene cyclase, partial [Bacillales bacterium]|nr:squalene--hopene cyclase [Bacillales bacterium]